MSWDVLQRMSYESRTHNDPPSMSGCGEIFEECGHVKRQNVSGVVV